MDLRVVIYYKHVAHLELALAAAPPNVTRSAAPPMMHERKLTRNRRLNPPCENQLHDSAQLSDEKVSGEGGPLQIGN